MTFFEWQKTVVSIECCIACHSKWRIRRVFPYISVLNDVTAQGLELVLDVVAKTTSIVFDLMQCFASDSHDTVVVMFRCV